MKKWSGIIVFGIIISMIGGLLIGCTNKEKDNQTSVN